MAAEIADSILKECHAAFGEESVSRLQSSSVLKVMSNGFKKGHAADATRSILGSMEDISYPVHVSMVNVGDDKLQPVIFLSDYIKCLAAQKQLKILTGGQPLDSCLHEFWTRFKTLRPDHPVFQLDESEWCYTIPTYLIADEGRGFKKSAVFVLGSEPVLGYGCDVEDTVTAQEALKMNFRGNTYKTRQLFSVMPKKRYNKDEKPLRALTEHWSADLGKCFTEGLDLKVDDDHVHVRIATLGLKADWPALTKLGCLVRHYLRGSYPWGPGICHLCEANTRDCPQWHQHTDTAPWAATMSTSSQPWLPTKESSLTKDIPMEPHMKADFYLVDLFHTCHKGVHADLAGSAIASRLSIGLYLAYYYRHSPLNGPLFV